MRVYWSFYPKSDHVFQHFLSLPLFPNHSPISNHRPKPTSLCSFNPCPLRPISRSPVLSSQLKTSFLTNCSSPASDNSSKDETPIELRFLAFPTVIDINQIREILPNRFPFLLVDRVIEYNPGVSAGVIAPHEGGGQVTVVEWWLCRTERNEWEKCGLFMVVVC
ncbi:putative beta-hydroxydecanoyl thiol ester dehydrase, FabA/FabZ, HotDog domain superfamily [Helianthus anomalus]